MPAAAHKSSHSRADKIRGGLLANAMRAIKGLIDNQALRFPQYSRFSSETEDLRLFYPLGPHVGWHALPRCLYALCLSDDTQTGKAQSFAVRFSLMSGSVKPSA